MLVGTGSTVVSGYLTIQYFLISKNKWYILDMSIDFLMIFGLFVTLVILLKETSASMKMWFYRIFIAMGVAGASSLMLLRFYYHIAIYRFPPKLIIATLIIDGIIIKMIHDKQIKPSLRPSAEKDVA